MPSQLTRRHVLLSAASVAAVAAVPAAAIAAVEVAPVLTTYVPEAFNSTPPLRYAKYQEEFVRGAFKRFLADKGRSDIDVNAIECVTPRSRYVMPVVDRERA